jgi:hypothetical protein
MPVEKFYHVDINDAWPTKGWGNLYHVQRAWRDLARKCSGGVVDFGTDSRLKLYLYILYLRVFQGRKPYPGWPTSHINQGQKGR